MLRSWDQFANLVLQDTVERIYAEKDKVYASVPRGLYLVRGENVLMLGEIVRFMASNEELTEVDHCAWNHAAFLWMPYCRACRTNTSRKSGLRNRHEDEEGERKNPDKPHNQTQSV